MPEFEVYVSWLEQHSGYITVDCESLESVEEKVLQNPSTVPEAKGGQDTFDGCIDASLAVLEVAPSV
jgi:hypothetical protein